MPWLLLLLVLAQPPAPYRIGYGRDAIARCKLEDRLTQEALGLLPVDHHWFPPIAVTREANKAWNDHYLAETNGDRTEATRLFCMDMLRDGTGEWRHYVRRLLAELCELERKKP